LINAVQNTLLWYQDRFAELSIPELEDAMSRYPGDHRLPLARAEALWLGGAQRQALSAVEAICEGWPGYVDPEVTRIRFVAERGDFQYARHLQDQLASNPHVTPEYMNWLSGVVDHIERGGEYSPSTYHSAAPPPESDDSGGDSTLGGAVVGGTIGTFLGGPLGTVAGAAVGGFIGALFEDDEGDDDLSYLEDDD